MNQIIELPWVNIPLTHNQVRRMHFQTEAKIKRTIIGEAITAIRRANTEPMDAAEVTLHVRPGTRRRYDIDSAGPTVKCCLDALVRAGVLEDDDSTRVPIVTLYAHEPTPGVAAGLWLTLEEPLDMYLNKKD